MVIKVLEESDASIFRIEEDEDSIFPHKVGTYIPDAQHHILELQSEWTSSIYHVPNYSCISLLLVCDN
jgi:hypothetical protein